VKKRTRIILLLAVVVVAASVIGWLRSRGSGGPVILSGNIEVIDARAGFKISGRLLERLVDEGMEVSAGQLIARLDAVDEELQLARAEAELAHAEASLVELEAGSRPEEIQRSQAQLAEARHLLAELEAGSRGEEIAAARAEAESATASAESSRAKLDMAQVERARVEKLFAQNVVSAQEQDVARTSHDAALKVYEEALAMARAAAERWNLLRAGTRAERIDQARDALRAAEAQHALVLAGTRKETIEKARAQVRIAKESVREALQGVENTKLSAPFAGTVLSKSAEPGEYLQPGAPVVTIGDLEHIWVRAYVSERDIGRVRLGQASQVTTDSFPGRTFRGRVSFIASEAEFTPKQVQTFEERVKLVFRVKIDLENPDRALKPGMPADAVIPTEESP
jgi:HlyD family secretion protein